MLWLFSEAGLDDADDAFALDALLGLLEELVGLLDPLVSAEEELALFAELFPFGFILAIEAAEEEAVAGIAAELA